MFDLDRHWIPVRHDESGHWHYDVRYIVRATTDEGVRLSDESLALAWRSIRSMADDEISDESLRRMARKWLARETRCDGRPNRIEPVRD